MEVNVNAPEDWMREVNVTIEAERLTGKIDELVDKYRGRAEVPGFRKGKAPRSVLLRRIGSALERAAVEELIETTVADIVGQQQLRLASEPRMTDLEIRPDKSVRLHLRVEVIPDFELRPYEGLKFRKQEPKGFDQEFERRLGELQDRCATFRSVQRPAATGDHVAVDYRLTDGDRELSKPRRNVMIQVGDRLNYAAVNRALTGVKAGDQVSVEVELPDDHPDKELAGRRVTYTFSVREVKEKTVPEVTEEFAQDLGYDNLDALRREINDSIIADRARLTRNGLKNQIFELLTAEHNFAPPESWVEANVARMLNEYGLPDTEDTRKRLRDAATKWAKFDGIVARNAGERQLQVKQEEVEGQIAAMAEGTGKSTEEVAPLLDNPSFRSQLLREKVLGHILEKAQIS